MDIKKEALRYLGYKGEPDLLTASLLERAEKASCQKQEFSGIKCREIKGEE